MNQVFIGVMSYTVIWFRSWLFDKLVAPFMLPLSNIVKYNWR